MKKFISLFLVFSILNISCATISSNHAETKVDPKKKGADLILQKKEGESIRGELIAVKQNSLVLMERESGGDVTIDIDDISVIRIVKKSKLLLGAGIGALMGGGIGFGVKGEWDEPQEQTAAILFPTGVAAIIGGLLGWLSGIDKTIQFEGKSDSEIQEILEKLRKKARVRNAQLKGNLLRRLEPGLSGSMEDSHISSFVWC